MKHLYISIALFLIFNLLLSACAPQEVILSPDDPNNPNPKQVIGISTSKTAAEQYYDCVKYVVENHYIVATVKIGNEPAEILSCKGPSIDASGLMLVPVSGIAKMTPTKYDDIVVYGVVVAKEVIKYALVAVVAVAAGKQIGVSITRLEEGSQLTTALLSAAAATALMAKVTTESGSVVWENQNGGCFGGVKDPTGEHLISWVDLPCPQGPEDMKGIEKFFLGLKASFNNVYTGYTWAQFTQDAPLAVALFYKIAQELKITIP